MSSLAPLMSTATAQAVAGACAAAVVGLLLVNGMGGQAQGASGGTSAAASAARTDLKTNNGKGSDNKTFSIAGSVSELAPGVHSTLRLTVTNHASQPIKIRSLSVSAADVRTSAGTVVCAGSSLLLGHPLTAGSGTTHPTDLLVEGRSTSTTDFPVLLATSVGDGCQDVTWDLTYSGTADKA